MTPDRRKSRTGRSASSRQGWDKKLYAEDPLYRHLSLLRKRWYRAANKERDNARRRRKAKDPDHRDKVRARRYGLSLQDYRAMLASQGNACAICKTSARPLCIDHCHATGKVRGLLCSKCNTGLGCYDDDPDLTQAATEYLRAAHGS